MPSLFDLRRTLAAFTAIALSAALTAFVLILAASFTTQVQAAARASMGGADLILLAPRGHHLPQDIAQRAQGVEGVASARPQLEQLMYIDRPGTAYDTHVFALLAPEASTVTGPGAASSGTGESPRLVEGRLPSAPGEVAVSPVLAVSDNIHVGDAVSLTSDPEAAPGTDASTVTVVGVVEPSATMTRFGAQNSYIMTTPEGWSSLGLAEVPVAVYLTVSDGASPQAVMEALTQALGEDADVYTADELTSLRAQNANALNSATLEILRLLAPVCAVVAIVVIATTFSTLVAHQTRQTGLLRCVGASRAQVRRLVLRTALGIGLVGSVLGTALGAGAAALLSRLEVVDGLSAQHLTITWTSVALAVVLSTAATVLAALRPAVQAGRVSPLIALTGKVSDDRRLSRRRVVTAALGLVIAGAGGAALAGGASLRVLDIMAAGACLMVVGVLIALPLVVVLATTAVERLTGAHRLPVLQLACRNLARNPGRTAATTGSLLVSVVVATTLLTAVAGVSASMDSYMSGLAPIDLRVDGIAADQDAAALAERVGSTEGVEQVVTVPSITLEMTSSEGSSDITVHSIDMQALAPVIRSQRGLEQMDDATLLLGGIYGVPDGTQVTLTGAGGSVTLTARVVESGFGPVITPAVASRLTGGEPTEASLWARTSGDGSSNTPAQLVREQLHGTGLLVSSGTDGREAFVSQVWRAVQQMGAILCLAVIISMVGLANTTDVSVLERTREIGVLRATGTARTQVRALFLTEAVLTTALGGLIGVVLGVTLGQAGVTGLMGQEGAELSLTVPWLQLVGVLIASAVVGLLAALRPASRAAAVAPVTALATD